MRHDRTTCWAYHSQVECSLQVGELGLLHHDPPQQQNLPQGTDLPKEEDIIDSLPTACKHPYP